MFFRAVHGGFYFIGIGGISMSALASLLYDRGFQVRGSDAFESDGTRMLRSKGIPVKIGEEEEITEKNVVYTSAVDEAHPQRNGAQRAGKRLWSRAELLGAIAEEYPYVLSVAGCHGKTSATSMLAHIFYSAKRPFTCHIGGEDKLLGNYRDNGKEYFITEACEFKRNFLHLHSTVSVILNIDRDHTDCYQNEQDLVAAYAQFAAQSKLCVVNAEDRYANAIPHSVSFGLNAGDIRAEKLCSNQEKYSFLVTEGGIPHIRIKLSVTGKVHVENALAAYAAARLTGLTPEEIKRGLESFQGVKRRFEHAGTICGAPVICDYAHHPREIDASFETAQKICSGTVRLVFQPHTYTRTRDLMDEFIRVLKKAENPIIYKTYAAREPFDDAGSAYTLVSRLPEAIYVQSPTQLYKRLSQLIQKDDLVLVLGAGDIYGIAKSIIKNPTV